MKRYGMVCGIKPDRIAAYKKLHAAVWPEVLERIKKCNLQNYSIYLKDELLKFPCF
jgi:L-rhamnose mutarotase